MLITKLALPGRNIMCTQFVQFSCCAEPHNCAFCCNLSLVDLFTRDPVLPSSAHCCSLASVAALDVKTSNSSIEWAPSNENCRTRRVKITLCWLAANTKKENNYNALKDIFEIAFMVLLCLQGKTPQSEEGRKDEIRDLRAIQMVKGFTETNNGYS